MPSSTGTVVFNDSRIKATGVIATENIGVGTANPTSNLHVVGDASITGNVGVGTTSPGFPLDVVFSGDSGIRAKSTSSHASLNLDSGSGYGYIRFQDSGSETIWLQSKPSGDLVIRPQGGNETVLFGANGNVGIGTVTPAAKLHVNGSIYSPGHPVQYVADNVHTIVSYGASTGGRYVTPLDVTITPKFSNSKIFVQWVINFEAHQDMVFRVYRGSTLIGYNTSIANNRWNGVSTPDYDQNQSSTPGQSTISWIDSPNTTSAVTYRVYVQSSSTGNYPFYLNRTYGSSDTGQDAYERMVSYKSATEIAV